jgi:hypothetical protein
MSAATRALALSLVLTTAACVPPYRAPRLDEPHAVVKLRRSYLSKAGTSLHEQLRIDDHQAYEAGVHAGDVDAPRIDALLVHPRAGTFSFSNQFFHVERRFVTESYAVQVPYTVNSYGTCGYGSSSYSCSRTSTQYRTEYRTRQVWKNVVVDNGTCHLRLRVAPAPNGIYLLEYQYLEPGECRFTCFEQHANPDGTFQNTPCLVPPAE